MLLEYLQYHRSIFVIGIVVIGILVYLTIFLLKRRQERHAVAAFSCVLGILLIIALSARFWVDRPTSTIVVMPDKQNLRLAEDGQLSFCIDGIARTWKGTSEGIISSEVKLFENRPMRCLSIEEGVEFLRQAGASDDELKMFRDVYN